MKYGKGKCAECGRSVLTTDDGRAIAHPSPGREGQCAGSAEPVEQAIPREPKTQAAAPTANGDGHAATLKIEKGIPVPKSRRGREGRFRGVLSEMGIGDSFVFPCNGKRSAEAAVRDAAKKAGVKVTLRRVDAGSIRVWRIQ